MAVREAPNQAYDVTNAVLASLLDLCFGGSMLRCCDAAG